MPYTRLKHEGEFQCVRSRSQPVAVLGDLPLGAGSPALLKNHMVLQKFITRNRLELRFAPEPGLPEGSLRCRTVSRSYYVSAERHKSNSKRFGGSDKLVWPDLNRAVVNGTLNERANGDA